MTPAPVAVGKKLKFCCGATIVDELESISRAMEGSQFAAAQQQIDKLIESKGSLACLLAMKGITLLATSQLDAARKNAELFRENRSRKHVSLGANRTHPGYRGCRPGHAVPAACVGTDQRRAIRPDPGCCHQGRHRCLVPEWPTKPPVIGT